MIHFNGNALLHIPVVYDDAARDRMDTHVPMKSYLLMHDALKSRDFELLQQDPTFRETLSKLCLCCGKQVTLTGPAKEHVLRHHLLTMHPEPQQAIQCLIQMVVHQESFLDLSWPHLGLHLEISTPRKLSWPHLGLHLEISRLEISPRKLSSPHLGLHLEISRVRDFTKKAFLTLPWPHLWLHLGITGLEISPRKLS